MSENIYRLNIYDVRKDGSVLLFQRPKKNHPDQVNPIFQVELKIPNAKKVVRISSKTSDRDEAVRFALEKFDDLYRSSLLGQQIHSTRFSKAFGEFEKYYSNPKIPKPSLKNRLHYLDQMRNHPYEFFVLHKNDIGVERINAKLIEEYFDYRRTTKSAADSTLIREHTYINAFLHWCVKQDLLVEVPSPKKPKQQNNRRATFSIKEWKVLTRKMKGWVESADNQHIRRDRFYLRDFVLLSSNCGARPGEMRELKWGQVRNHKYPDGEQRMVAEFPSGKTGKRESVFNVGSDVFFKRLWDFRWEELGHAPSPDEFVFCSRDGSKVIDRKKSFASLLNYCGLRTNVAGELRSLYSLRHFYAHQQLRNDPPTSVYDLARNMGTSVKVIESNYGDKDNVSRGQNIGRKSGSWDTNAKETDHRYAFMR